MYLISPPPGIGPVLARIAIVAAVAALAVLASTATADAAVLLAAGQNPFNEVVPDFSVFGTDFNNAWKKALAGIWALGFVWLAFGAIRATADFVKARKGGYGAQVADAKSELFEALQAVAAMSALPIIFGAAMALF